MTSRESTPAVRNLQAIPQFTRMMPRVDAVAGKKIGRILIRLILLSIVSLCLGWRHSPHLQAQEPFGLSYFSDWSSVEKDDTWSLAWGDVDGDGDIDLAVGNTDEPNRVYINDNGTLQTQPNWSSAEEDSTKSVAWGDVDGDGDLDLAVGNDNEQPNRLYLNEGGQLHRVADWFSDEKDSTKSVAWGDVDGDGDLDLAVGNNGQPNRIYLNNGNRLEMRAGWSSNPNRDGTHDNTYSIAWGDMDRDGDLDLAVGNMASYDSVCSCNVGGENLVYLNQDHMLTKDPDWTSDEKDFTASVAWGDMDGDGYLDLAVGNTTIDLPGCQCHVPNASRIYLNKNKMLQIKAHLSFGDDDSAWNVAWGDMDGDGDLDLAVSNTGYANRLYLNDNKNLQIEPIWSSSEVNYTYSIAWGDVDGDGDLDLATGQYPRVHIYHNHSTVLQSWPEWLSAESDDTRSVAWGDVDGDGDLDLAVGNYGQANRLYLSENDQLTQVAAWSSTDGPRNTTSIAWGDVNGDGQLDLAVGNHRQKNQIYLNTGNWLETNASWESDEEDATWSIAWGDVDSDGDLDLAVGNAGERYYDIHGHPSRLYRNDNGISLEKSATWTSDETENTWDVAWGDMDGDGDLDLAAANYWQALLYQNESGILGNKAKWFSSETDGASSVAWGDANGDGYSDLAVGNDGYLDRVHMGQKDGLKRKADWFAHEWESTKSVAWGDVDGDGDLDLAAGADNNYNTLQLYINQAGKLDTIPIWASQGREFETNDIAWGDMDGDGDLDLAVGVNGQNRLYLNTLHGRLFLPNNHLSVSQAQPDVRMADHYSQASFLTSNTIPLTYTLRDAERDSVGQILVEYSVNGGGQWQPAMATTETITTHLTTSPSGVTHVYNWNTFASGLFGQSDNVVVRMVAYSQPLSNTIAAAGTYKYVNATPGAIQRPYASATTYPFRVRGTQVRVYRESQDEAHVAADALVYRIPGGQSSGGFAMASDSAVYRTDNQGYLQGRGRIEEGDHLVALLPITATTHYTVYLTSAAPTATSLTAIPMKTPGVQPLVVSADNPLILVNLNVSLEWDARKDTAYLQQLQADLQRASELLYDATNGQAALGNMTVYHARQHWNEADIRIYASNRLRPHATIGGVNDLLTVAVLGPPQNGGEAITKAYVPGQIHMPAAWNRTGETSGNLGEDWPRTLVHELGHYLFYLLENYMGVDERSLPFAVTLCPGIMGNAYLAANSELHPANGWPVIELGVHDCTRTLQQKVMQRSDWETVKGFYPWLKPPTDSYTDQNSGPSSLPLAVTQVRFEGPTAPPITVDVPTYYLVANGSRYSASTGARAYLFKDKEGILIDLGQPRQDRLQIWGAEVNDTDRICVYDLARTTPMLGCKGTKDRVEQLRLYPQSGWQPDIAVTAATSRTVSIQVANLSSGLSLQAQLYPSGADVRPATEVIDLTYDSARSVYKGKFVLINPSVEARLHVWVDEAVDTPREAVVDYTLNGAPVLQLSDGHALYLSDGHALMLSDGRVEILNPGNYIIQGNGNALQLSDGSILQLSDGSALQLSDGTALQLSDGGALQLSDGSALQLSDGGAPLELNDGSALQLSDGGAPLELSDGSAFMLSDGNGPILSSDGQVQIFGEQLNFKAGEFYSLQSLIRLPDPPQWTTVVGQGYRLTRSPGAPSLDNSSISFRYLGRDVPAGEENFLHIYHYNGTEWKPLSDTVVDKDQNMAVASVAGEGIYVLMSAIEVSLDGPGWELFAYPVQGRREVTEALLSIDDAYSTVYGYELSDPNNDPWKVYDKSVARYVNDLSHLDFGKGYWIHLNKPVTALFKGASSGAVRQIDMGQGPPATFYGAVVASDNFNPLPGMTVTAWINGQPCGQGRTLEFEGEVVYTVDVFADGRSSPGCGIEGSNVTFEINSQKVGTVGIWNDRQLWELPMQAAVDTRLFLPTLLR